jgi:hypothetical protein
MKSGTKNTIWTIALVAVFLFLVWKLWPILNAALSGAGGGGASGGSVTGGDEGDMSPDYFPYQQQQSPLQSLLSSLGNLFSGSGSGGGSGAGSGNTGGMQSVLNDLAGGSLSADSAATDWSQLALSEGWDNAGLLSGDQGDDLSGDQIPYDTTQNFDFGDYGYSPDDSGGDGGGDGGGD